MIAKFTNWSSDYAENAFEWDDEKSLLTLEQRSLALPAAILAFRGRCIRREDNREDYSETCYQVLCELHGKVLMVVFTPRNQKCRMLKKQSF